jgi:hypothetical protein
MTLEMALDEEVIAILIKEIGGTVPRVATYCGVTRGRDLPVTP